MVVERRSICTNLSVGTDEIHIAVSPSSSEHDKLLNLADVLIKAKEIIEKEDNPPCPECGSDNLNVLKEHMSGRLTIHCMSCGKWFDNLELYEKDDVKGKWKEYCSNYKKVDG